MDVYLGVPLNRSFRCAPFAHSGRAFRCNSSFIAARCARALAYCGIYTAIPHAGLVVKLYVWNYEL